MQTIKLADLLDNLPGVVTHDLKFAKIYVREAETFLANIQEGDASLPQQVIDEIRRAKNKIEQ